MRYTIISSVVYYISIIHIFHYNVTFLSSHCCPVMLCRYKKRASRSSSGREGLLANKHSLAQRASSSQRNLMVQSTTSLSSGVFRSDGNTRLLSFSTNIIHPHARSLYAVIRFFSSALSLFSELIRDATPPRAREYSFDFSRFKIFSPIYIQPCFFHLPKNSLQFIRFFYLFVF